MRRLAAWCVGALFCLSGCDNQPLPASAQLAGTYDLVISGSLLFVTSANENELRVIELAGTPRGFVRAPNPIQPLAIPVVDSPSSLAVDVRWDAESGQPVPGSYVFARSGGSREISVVSAAPEDLVEVARVFAGGGTPLAPEGPVTAFASRALGDGGAILYYAVYSSGEGTLRQVEIPPVSVLKENPGLNLGANERVLATLPGEAVTSLLVLPNAEGVDARSSSALALATRDAVGSGGRAVRVEVKPLPTGGLMTQLTQTLDFGAPVRALKTHGRAPEQFGVSLDAAARIFGVLDESSCRGEDTCRGIVAVDASTGVLCTDATGAPMQPLRFGDGLVTGFDLAVDVPLGGLTPAYQPVVGFVSSSDGQLSVFDAVHLRPFDVDAEGARVVSVDYQNAGKRAAVEGLGPTNFVLGNGKARDEELRIVYQGVLPGLEDVAFDGTTYAVPWEYGLAIAPGDRVQVTGEGGCRADLVVDAVSPGAAATGTSLAQPSLLTVSGDLGACTGLSEFTVRADGAQPFVVTGSVSGFMGRVGEGQAFVYPGTAFARPEGFDPNAAQLSFQMGLIDAQIAQDDAYVVTVEDGYSPYSYSLGSDVGQVHMPAALQYSSDFNRLFIAFPSGNEVVEVDPEVIVPLEANVRNVESYQ